MAKIPPLQDDRLDFLVSIYANAALRLQRQFGRLVLAEQPRRLLIYQQILDELRDLERRTDAWSAQFIRQFVADADKEALQTITAAGITATFADTIDPVAVENLANSMRGKLSSARQSVAILATRIFRSPAIELEFPELALQVRQEVAIGLAAGESTFAIRREIASRLQDVFTDGLVTLSASNGRQMSFPLDYYAAMVASATKRQARTVAMLQRAAEGSMDLVRVSTNPSKGGDWCDAYRGRVYSISGTSDTYPPMASLPNGGPPFHPFCKHSIGIFVPEFYSQEQQEEFAKTQERFLLSPGEEKPNRIARNWWNAKKKTDDPAPLKFI